MLWLDLDGCPSEPVSMVSERYRDFTTYNTMIYTRGELFFHQLRYLVGDETMHRILRTYLRPLEAQARGRGSLSRRGGGGLRPGLSGGCSRSGCTTLCSSTTGSGA